MGVLENTLIADPGILLWNRLIKASVTPQDAGATTTIWTITGDVKLRTFAVCKTALTSGGAITLELGVSGNTASLIAKLADAKTLIANEIWHDATPTLTVEAVPQAVHRGIIVTNGQDAILTPAGTFTAGVIDFYGFWARLSANGKVEAA